jgi:hypothetical protein
MNLVTKLVDETAAKDIHKILYSTNKYMGVELTEEQQKSHFQRLVNNFAANKNGRVLVIAYENKEPIAMAAGLPMYEYNSWAISDARTTKFSSYFNYEASGLKACYYFLCNYMENLGFHTYYAASDKSTYKARMRLKKQCPELTRYEETIYKIIPGKSFCSDPLVFKYIVGARWPEEIYIRKFSLRPKTTDYLDNYNIIWNEQSQSVSFLDFLSKKELIEINRLADIESYFYYMKSSPYEHKIARLDIALSPILVNLTKRLYDIGYELNKKYWKFDLDTNYYNIDGSEVCLGMEKELIQPHLLINNFQTNDYMILHNDYNPYCPEASRKIAMVMQITNPDLYEGGELNLHIGENKIPASKQLGSIIFYPSFIPHSVSTVTRGARRSLIYFFRGNKDFC